MWVCRIDVLERVDRDGGNGRYRRLVAPGLAGGAAPYRSPRFDLSRLVVHLRAIREWPSREARVSRRARAVGREGPGRDLRGPRTLRECRTRARSGVGR